jgi:hypothetical protein
MAKKYSKSTGGWYDTNAHQEIPGDAYDVPVALYNLTVRDRPANKVTEFDNAGMPYLADLPAPTVEQIIVGLTAAVQQHMDDAARAYGYDNISSAVTYADEPAVEKFQKEGRAFRAWRSLVWAACYSLMPTYTDGPPTAGDLIARLPSFTPPAA